jgi:hypothetical protein
MTVAWHEVPGNFHHRCAVPSGRLIAPLVPRIFCVEFYVLRCERRQLEMNIISGAADALAASPIEKQDETTARNTLPWGRQTRGNDRINRPFAFGTVRSFLFFQALRARLLSSESLPPSSRHSMRRRGGESTTADRLGQICER